MTLERNFFEWVFDAFEGFAHEVDGELNSTWHRCGLKVWYGAAVKEHYEAQLIRTTDGAALEIGFHAEYPKVDQNEAVIGRLLEVEKKWRRHLGADAEVGEFLGADRWRRISEVWDAPDPDDPESSLEIGARLADYVLAIEPFRRLPT